MDDESRVLGSWSDKKNIIILVLAVVVIAMVGFFLWFNVALQGNNLNNASGLSGNYVIVGNTPTPNSTTTIQQSVPKVGVITENLIPVTNMADYAIDVTTAGFSPSDITITKGQSVVWTIRDNHPHWILANPSDPYPLKGTCGSLFDSCKAVKLGIVSE